MLVFESDGRLIRSVGSAGDGPGEFGRTIRGFLVTAGDSLILLGDRRIMIVYDPHFQVSRSVVLPRQPMTTIAHLQGGSVVLDGIIRTPSAIGWPYHVVAPTGVVTRSFGNEREVRPPRGADTVGTSDMGTVPFVLAGDGRSIWSWHGREHRAEQWDIGSGARMTELTVDGVNWLTPRADIDYSAIVARVFEAGPPAPSHPVPPASTSVPMHVDPENRLWIRSSAVVPRGQRLEGVLASCTPHERAGYPDYRFCSMIEVFDLTRGTLLLSQPIDPALQSLAGTDVLFRKTENTDGVVALEFFRVSIVRN